MCAPLHFLVRSGLVRFDLVWSGFGRFWRYNRLRRLYGRRATRTGRIPIQWGVRKLIAVPGNVVSFETPDFQGKFPENQGFQKSVFSGVGYSTGWYSQPACQQFGTGIAQIYSKEFFGQVSLSFPFCRIFDPWEVWRAFGAPNRYRVWHGRP